MQNLAKTKGLLLFAVLVAGSLLFISAQGNNKTVTLELWTPNANTICQNGEVILAEAIAAFEKKNPQIKISHQYKGYYDEYKAALSEAFASNTEPDIFAGFPGSFLESYRQQNQLLALDNYLSAKFKAGILKGALPNVSAGGKIYGIPFTGHIALILCNTEIFEQNNLAYPQTFDELVERKRHYRHCP
jgi:ABC-type glycerol-3-phosphate transport system substrate-binding protein